MTADRLKLRAAYLQEEPVGQGRTLAILAVVLLLVGGAIVGASLAKGTVAGALVGVVLAAAGQMLKHRSGSRSCC